MQEIRNAINKALIDLKMESVEFSVEHPRDEAHGDYSTNVAMVLWKQISNHKLSNSQIKSPREVAEKLVTSLQNDIEIDRLIDLEKLEVAGAGFINFFLKPEFFLGEMLRAKSEKYGKNENLIGKKVMVEYTDPNPFKEMHIGHLMSNTIGESLTRILEMQGAEVKRVCYQGDVGLHVAKAVWGMMNQSQITNPPAGEAGSQILKSDEQITNWIAEWGKKSLNERQQMMGQAYAYGAAQYEESMEAKEEMHKLNKDIYDSLSGVSRKDELLELYHTGRSWSLEYFETIYSRLGTKFDEYFFESEAGPVGLKVVEEAIAKGVLEEGEGGAVVYHGEKDGLHTRVFRNKLGLATYEGKELGLSKTKYERYKYDLSYIVTANEISEYFKVLLKVMSQLYPELASKTTHIAHGMMKLTTGKMSSRTGKVVTGEGLLNDLKDVVIKKMGERTMTGKQEIADKVAVGALKYTVLKQAIGGDIVYDPDKMTNLEGATGPFVQYTYARANSILRKIQVDSTRFGTLSELLQGSEPCKEEANILRWIYRYPEVVLESGKTLSPHIIATYITELASRFNSFYQACRVEEDGEVNVLRYELTEAVASVLKSGLNVLGIVATAEM